MEGGLKQGRRLALVGRAVSDNKDICAPVSRRKERCEPLTSINMTALSWEGGELSCSIVEIDCCCDVGKIDVEVVVENSAVADCLKNRKGWGRTYFVGE